MGGFPIAPLRRTGWGRAIAIQCVAGLVAGALTCLEPGPLAWEKVFSELWVASPVDRSCDTREAGQGPQHEGAQGAHGGWRGPLRGDPWVLRGLEGAGEVWIQGSKVA